MGVVDRDKAPQAARRGAGLKLGAVLLLALALRCVKLDAYPFWHDEVHNLLCAENLWNLLTRGHWASNHPPLPYILLRAWRDYGPGTDEWMLRLLPVTFGVLAVWAAWFLGKTLFDQRTGLIAALLLAVSPLHIVHSQDLKEYIYLPFFGLVMGAFLYRAARGGAWRDWIAYGVTAGLGCFAEAFVVPLLAAMNLWCLFMLGRDKKQWIRWFTANAVGALMFLPWLSIMLFKVRATMIDADDWWVPHPTWVHVYFYFKAIAYGYMAGKPWFYIASVVLFAALAWGILAAFRRNRSAAALLVAWFVLPVAMVFALSYIAQSIFLIRAMLPYAMAVYVLAAAGVAALRSPAARAAALALLLAFPAVGLVQYYQRDYPPLDFPHRPGTHPPRDYDKSAAYILENMKAGDEVIHTSDATWFPFDWYGFRGKSHKLAGLNNEYVKIISTANPRNTPDAIMDYYYPHVVDELLDGTTRVWLVYAEWERKYLPGNADYIWRWMDAHYTEVRRVVFSGIEVRLYEPRAMTPVTAQLEDDGATQLRAQGGGEYRMERPDSGLVPVPVEQRRQRLRLAFAEGPAGETVELTPAAQGGAPLSFSLENTSPTDTVSVSLEVIASDVFIPALSLWKTPSKLDVWHAAPRQDPANPDRKWPQYAMCADFSRGEASLFGAVAAGAGAYEFWGGMVIPDNAPQYMLAPLTWSAGGAAVITPMDSQEAPPPVWGWRKSGESVPADAAGTISLRLDGTPFPEKGGYAFADGVLLRRMDNPANAATPPAWNGMDTLKPGAKKVWSVTVSPGYARTDIRVLEQGPAGGWAYHIFRTKSDAPVVRPAQ